MAAVNLTSEFGLVVRRAALEQRGLSYQKLLDAMETEAPLDVNDDLISLGPHFGSEAATELCRRLESLGLINIYDFFLFTGDFPEWCGFTGYLNEPPRKQGEVDDRPSNRPAPESLFSTLTRSHIARAAISSAP